MKKKFFNGIIAALMAFCVCLAAACGKVEVTGIAVDASNAKTVFQIGEAFATDGLSVTATMSDDSTKEIAVADCMVSDPDMSTAGEKTVTVTYEGKSDSYCITVSEPDPTIAYQNWSASEWAEVDWSAQTVEYQFFGTYNGDAASGGMKYICMNLYENHLLKIEPRVPNSSLIYSYWGYWTLNEGVYGDSLAMTVLYCSGGMADFNHPALITEATAQGYEMYDDGNGNFAGDIRIGLAYDAYWRPIAVTGSKNVAYPNAEDWYAYVDTLPDVAE